MVFATTCIRTEDSTGMHGPAASVVETILQNRVVARLHPFVVKLLVQDLRKCVLICICLYEFVRLLDDSLVIILAMHLL